MAYSAGMASAVSTECGYHFTSSRRCICTLISRIITPSPTSIPPTHPNRHNHTEIQYTPSEQVWANKDVHYDYTNLAMRYDITYLSGPQVPFITLLNFTSLWLGNNLYMITWETPLDNTPFCIELSWALV